jgi:hypothetical protein
MGNYPWSTRRRSEFGVRRPQNLLFYPNSLDDVKGALKQTLIPTLQEAGCEGMFETSRESDPHSSSSLRSSPLRRHISFTLNRTT